MSVLGSSGLVGLVWLLVLVACPLLMLFMMRGGRGHAGHGHGDEPVGKTDARAAMSLDELKRERDELNAVIGERAEQAVEAKR